MKTILQLSTALLLTLWAARPAFAQDALAANPRVLDPTQSSSVRSALPSVLLSASQGEERLQAQAGVDIGRLSFVLGASAPVGEGKSDVALVDFVGPSDATSVSLAVSSFIWGPSTITQKQQLARERWCERQPRARVGNVDCERFREGDLPDSVRSEFARFRRFGTDIPLQFGGQIAVTPATYDFVDPVTLEGATERHATWRAEAGFAAFLTPLLRLSVDAGYERAFSAGRTVTLCQPLVSPGASTCGDAVFGAPTRDDGGTMKGEARGFIPVGSNYLGVSGQASYRSARDGIVIRAPIYFLPNASNALIGGIAPVYDSGSRRFNIILFVGPAFGLSR